MTVRPLAFIKMGVDAQMSASDSPGGELPCPLAVLEEGVLLQGLDLGLIVHILPAPDDEKRRGEGQGKWEALKKLQDELSGGRREM